MEKAFDTKELANRFKAEGLPMLEDDVQKAAKILFGWAEESCAMKGGFFMVAVPLLPLLAEQLDKLADKLDGVEGK